MHKYLLLYVILFSQIFIAQNDTDGNLTIEQKTKNWDTLKYQKFDYVFIVGIYQLHRDFSNEFVQKINRDTARLSKHTYYAESDFNTGLVLNYDKFQLSFGLRTKPRDDKAGKGFTNTFNLGFSFGDNRWVCENYFRRFKGFYNQNTPSFDTTFAETGKYYLQPGLTSNLFMNRFMYFTNYENFSFKSGFGCNYRQLKSAATWILGGSFNTYNFHNDGSIFPENAQPLFNDYGSLQGFQSVNMAFNVGAAATVVIFKAWFVSAYLTFGPEQQWRTYGLGTSQRKLSYISGSGTGRFAFGLNLKRFYWLASTSTDYTNYSSKNIMDFKSRAITVNVALGWRFHTGTPDFYGKFQKSKLYKLFG